MKFFDCFPLKYAIQIFHRSSDESWMSFQRCVIVVITIWPEAVSPKWLLISQFAFHVTKITY